MAKLVLLGLLFNGVVLVSNPGTPDSQSEYRALLREKKALEQKKKILELEECLVAASLQDSTAYLVVDLGTAQITAKLGGVALRSAPILWRYGRPGHERVLGIFEVVEQYSTVADSARAAAADTVAARDTLKLAPRGPVQRRYDPMRRYRLSLRDGPDLWLASLPPDESRMDTLTTRLRAWLRDFPASVDRQSIHLVVSPADAHWIFSMAILGTRVLVVPSS